MFFFFNLLGFYTGEGSSESWTGSLGFDFDDGPVNLRTQFRRRPRLSTLKELSSLTTATHPPPSRQKLVPFLVNMLGPHVNPRRTMREQGNIDNYLCPSLRSESLHTTNTQVRGTHSSKLSTMFHSVLLNNSTIDSPYPFKFYTTSFFSYLRVTSGL